MLQPHSNTEESRWTRPRRWLWSASGPGNFSLICTWLKAEHTVFHCFSCYDWICTTFKVSVQIKMKETSLINSSMDDSDLWTLKCWAPQSCLIIYWVTLVFRQYRSGVIKGWRGDWRKSWLFLFPDCQTSALWWSLSTWERDATCPVHGGSIMDRTCLWPVEAWTLGPLWVSYSVWHRDIGGGSTESCSLPGSASMERTCSGASCRCVIERRARGF